MSTPSLRDELHGVFGPDALAWGSFYRNRPALRFELSLGGGRIEMFSQAWDRAREVLAAAFDGTEELVVVLSRIADEAGRVPVRDVLRYLRDCAVDLGRPACAWRADAGPEWEGEVRCFAAFRCGPEVVQPLLWGALAKDIGIRPRLGCDVYLADLRRGILAHPYDDRGMDVIGPSHALAELYRRFNPWLLDYDRERMDEDFAG